MASSATDTLEGSLERLVYANDDGSWCVARLEIPGRLDTVTVVGNLIGVQPGENLRLTGTWETDRRYGRQFRASNFTTLLPTTTAAIEKYLGSGLIKGVGKAMAKRLVAHFGEEALDVIDRYSARLEEVEGIGPKRSQAIREAWLEQREIKEVMLFLQAHDVAVSHAIRIYKTYGNDAIRIVRQDPYRLAADIWGIGFKTADQIAANLGIPSTSPLRAAAGVVHLLGQASEGGHLFLPRERLVRQAEELLDIPADVIQASTDSLLEEGRLISEPEHAGDDGPPIYLVSLHGAETGLAASLIALAAASGKDFSIDTERALAWYERQARIELAPKQKEAIRKAIEHRVVVITGGPGTGKTTLIRGIVQILGRKGLRIQLAAPTGRAAKRLAEATGGDAKTLHRLLEFTPRTMRFARDADNPLDGDALIVDEASMLDTNLANSLLHAVPPTGRLVLVGDIDQLPSVGPGNVLKDLIASRAVAVVRLDEIFRQARQSRIVINSHRINRGEMPELEGGEGSDFFFIERREPEEILETVSYLVSQRIPNSFGLDPRRDIQVLAPMNRGTLGVTNLNEELRRLLNPTGTEVSRGGRLLRAGDKVMQIRNNYDLDVYNGDIGWLEQIDAVEQEATVRFDQRPVIYPFNDLDELVPAYACSIHKSQGSEYPCVVVPLHGQHYVMLERNLLYTALTRAKRLAVLVGDKPALGRAVRNHRARQRFTLLAERLRTAR